MAGFFTTPLGTTGLGNSTAPTETSVGSGDTFTPIKEPKKKHKKNIKPLKEYIKEK